MSNGEELAVRIRDYARERDEDASDAVSSAWLARELGADPRTIAAALRPYGIKPAEVERGVRGYMIDVLAGLALRSGEPSEPVSGQPPAPAQAAGGVPAVQVPAGAPPAAEWEDCSRFHASEAEHLVDCSPWSAIERLSAGAGHDMTPALRAAGLL